MMLDTMPHYPGTTTTVFGLLRTKTAITMASCRSYGGSLAFQLIGKNTPVSVTT